MSDKPKTEVHRNSWNPRYGARSYNAHEIEIEALDFAALEAAADIKLDGPARMRLVSAINCYYSDAAYRADAPDAEDVRRRMSALEKHARALAEWLAVKDSADHARSFTRRLPGTWRSRRRSSRYSGISSAIYGMRTSVGA